MNALAWLLILDPTTPIPPDIRPELVEAEVRRIAVAAEWADEGEIVSLNDVRRRRREMAGYPDTSHANRFRYDRNVVRPWLRFNAAYTHYCREQAETDLALADHWNRLAAEAERLYWVWDAVDDCQPGERVERRRRALQQLRTLLGDEAFEAGRLPPYIPLWRFREMP